MRCTASRSKVSTWSGSSSAVCGRSTPIRSPSRSGSTTARSRPSSTIAERYGRFEIDRQDFGGQTADFRVKLRPGRSQDRRRHSADLRRAAGAVQRPQSFDAAGSAARVHAAARHAARAAGGAEAALRRSAGGDREDPAERRARRERGSRWPVFAGHDRRRATAGAARSTPAATPTGGTSRRARGGS